MRLHDSSSGFTPGNLVLETILILVGKKQNETLFFFSFLLIYYTKLENSVNQNYSILCIKFAELDTMQHNPNRIRRWYHEQKM